MAFYKISFLLCVFVSCNAKPLPYHRRTVTVVQKSAGITVLYPELPMTTTPQYANSKNESESNATKMIENVLNSVVQSSMNDMLLKLTNSLSDLFSMFTAATSHNRQQKGKQKKEEIPKSHNRASFDTSKFNEQETAQLENVRQDYEQLSSIYEKNSENIVGDNAEEATYFENEQLQNKSWWRNILMKILKKNKITEEENNQHLFPLTVLPTTVYPFQEREETATKVFTRQFETLETVPRAVFENFTNTLTTVSTILHYPLQENDTIDIEEFQISPTPDDSEINVSAIQSSIQNRQLATTAVFNTENKNSISSPSIWELLIRLDNGLQGKLKNLTVAGNSGRRKPEAIVLDHQNVVAAKSILITGDPRDDGETSKSITPLPNRPIKKSNNLFFQTVLISCVAVFAIFVFSCFGVALACYGRKRQQRQRRSECRQAGGGKFSTDGRGLPRIFAADPGGGGLFSRRPIFKTCASSPYYYDTAARSDWSLMSRDRDRQVETYFATAASVLNSNCDSSSSPASSTDGPSSATAAILH